MKDTYTKSCGMLEETGSWKPCGIIAGTLHIEAGYLAPFRLNSDVNATDLVQLWHLVTLEFRK
jgi:hypothetical protein